MAQELSYWILTLVIFTPLAGALLIGMVNARSYQQIRHGALIVSLTALGFAIAALQLFHSAKDIAGNSLWRTGHYALTMECRWIGDPELLPSIALNYSVGVDGISIWLVLLTALICPLAIWASSSGIRERIKEYYILMLLLETGLLGVFCARDLLLFYIFFEFTLVPLYFIIGIWGGPEKRRAANRFFLYTLTGSMLTFAGILYLAYQAYCSPLGRFTFDMEELYKVGRSMTMTTQMWLFLALAAGFAVKVPLMPFHTWLPLAHTEAPTAGSVLLAGVLLKLGTYGFLRLAMPMLPSASVEIAPVMASLAIIGIIAGSLSAWVQNDFKKLIAYSSVAHLGMCILGMFSLKLAGLTGSVIYMVNHGLSTGALFLVIGMMYERYHTRTVGQIGGLARQMPWLAFFLVFFTLSSIGLPGLNGFVGEFLVLVGTFTSGTTFDGREPGPLNTQLAIMAATGVVLGAVYMLWLCEQILFGEPVAPAGTPDISNDLKPDLTRREISILSSIAFLCLFIGLWPKPMIITIQPAVQEQIVSHVLLRTGAVENQDLEIDQPTTHSQPVETLESAAETKEGQ